MKGLKVLVVSNFYPPHYIGGYELGCRDVVNELRARGHTLKVLTSTYGVGAPQVDGDVYRWLCEDLTGQQAREELARPKKYAEAMREVWRKEWTNQRRFRRMVRAFRPDVVY